MINPDKVLILGTGGGILILRWLLGMWVGKMGRWTTLGLIFILMPAALSLLAPGSGVGGSSARSGWIALAIIVVGVFALVGSMAGKLPAPRSKREEKEAWA